MTYEGAVDLEKVTDPRERSSIEDQIREFGQTPKQLFTRPHVSRNGEKILIENFGIDDQSKQNANIPSSATASQILAPPTYKANIPPPPSYNAIPPSKKVIPPSMPVPKIENSVQNTMLKSTMVPIKP